MANQKNKTHERRKKALDALNGEYNGWWIYQYYSSILGGNNLKRRQMDWFIFLDALISSICIAIPLWVFYIGIKILIMDWLNGK